MLFKSHGLSQGSHPVPIGVAKKNYPTRENPWYFIIFIVIFIVIVIVIVVVIVIVALPYRFHVSITLLMVLVSQLGRHKHRSAVFFVTYIF